MEKRINVGQLEPAAYKAILGLEGYLASSSLDKTHKELIKIRASQINGCAYCINMHTTDARKNGESEARIYLLNAWKEVDGLYSNEERAILALTEEMTLISQGGVSTSTYEQARSLFDEHYLAQLMVAIITINAWNRMAIATLMQPELG
ncbi:MAG: carboxymuconolactone decarboxylase family protein [Pedobacter sp.]|nr:carboxymuconolactone decarboxylase family protein [Pedobacter sp.]MDQ8052732.1 carboxymuconolactone decarboxylase family protein [Pedobacter sp.]